LLFAGLVFTPALSSATAQPLLSAQTPTFRDSLTTTRLADAEHQIQVLREALASEQHKSAQTKNLVAAVGFFAGTGIIAAAHVSEFEHDDADRARIRLIPVILGAACIVVAFNALISK
jgi:hypothetical protein